MEENKKEEGKQKIYIVIKPKREKNKQEAEEARKFLPQLFQQVPLPQALQPKEEEKKEESIFEEKIEPIPMQDLFDKKMEDVKEEELEEEELRKVSMRYPLITLNNKVFASANIIWNPETRELNYILEEPKLTGEQIELLKKIEGFIKEKINVDFTKLRKSDAINYLTRLFSEALDYFNIKKIRDKSIFEIFQYYLFRDFIGMERIEPLMHDPYIEDISCDGVGIPIYVYHKDPRIGSIKTNIVFENREVLNRFVIKLGERCGKVLSLASPLLDGTLPDGSRVQATLESDIARRGSNFTIRKFSEKPLTPIHLLKFGTCDIATLSYLWFLIEHGCSALIAGGTASGKTTLLNVLCSFIKPQLKVVSIEDTAELQLYHPHWVPQVARVSIAKEEREIDLYELLREALRQRPDYIIVGEVRGREAYVLFQQMALGHAGLATIHAESFQKLIDRLTTPPISLPASLIQNLDMVIFIARVRLREKYVRRIISITEITGYDRERNEPKGNDVIRWDPMQDKFIARESYLLAKISKRTGIKIEDIKKDLKDRAKFLYFLAKKGVESYEEMVRAINLFYTARETIMERIEAMI